MEEQERSIAKLIKSKTNPAFNKMFKLRRLSPEQAAQQLELRKLTSLVTEKFDDLGREVMLVKMSFSDEAGTFGIKTPSAKALRDAFQKLSSRSHELAIKVENLSKNMKGFSSVTGSPLNNSSFSSPARDLTSTNFGAKGSKAINFGISNKRNSNILASNRQKEISSRNQLRQMYAYKKEPINTIV